MANSSSLIAVVWKLLCSPRGKQTCKYSAITFVALVTISLTIPFLYPSEHLKQRFITHVKNETGRTVRIDGDMSLRILPRPGVHINDVTILNPHVFDSDAPTLLKAPSLDIDFDILAFITGEYLISNLTVQNPLINLYVDSEKVINWRWDNSLISINKHKHQKRRRGKKRITKKKPEVDLPFGLLSSNIKIINGDFNYTDINKEEDLTIVNVNGGIELSNKGNHLIANGTGIWEGETADWFLQIKNTKAFLTDERAALNFNLTNKLFAVNGRGFLERGVYSGSLNIAISSLKDLPSPLQLPIEIVQNAATPLEFNISSNRVECSLKLCTIKNAPFRLDKIRGRMWLVHNRARSLPYSKLSFQFKGVNLNTLFPPVDSESRNLIDIKKVKERKKRGFGGVWDTTPLDLDLFKRFNADIEIRAKNLFFKTLHMSDPFIKVKVKKGEVTVSTSNTPIFDGKISTTLSVNVNATPYRWLGIIDFTAIDSAKALHQLTPFKLFNSIATTQIHAHSTGNTALEMVSNLSAKGMMVLTGGYLRGIDLAGMFYNDPKAFSNKINLMTQFDNMHANYEVKNGVLESNNLKLNSRLLKATGEGTIDFANWSVDYTFIPKTVIRLHRNSKSKDPFKPVRVTGSLNAPRYSLVE